MPLLKKPLSLQQLSLESGSQVILYYAISSQQYYYHMRWKDLYNYVERFVPPKFRSDMFHEALKKLSIKQFDYLRPETIAFLLRLLLHPVIKELSFSDLAYAGGTSYELLDLFESMLSSCLPYLPSLTHLDLSTHRTDSSLPSCSYSVLHAIGMHCPNLLILDLNYNNRVTGAGLHCLAPSKDTPGCPNLEEIYVQDCSLMAIDIVWLIQNFQNLRNIGYQDMGTILKKLKHIASRNRKYRISQIKLTHFDNSESTCGSSDGNVIKLVGQMCPYVDNLKVRICDDDCQELYYLKYITKLELRFYTGVQHRIGPKTIAYIKTDGHYLTSLTIYCALLNSYHVTIVASNCINLRKLFLRSNSFEEVDESFDLTPNKMEGLRVLSIKIGLHEMDESSSANFLASYLISPCFLLQEIYLLLCCAHVDYDFLSNCFNYNTLSYLKIFICDAPRRNQSLPMVHLGYQAAMMLIETCPKLNTLGNLISWSILLSEVEELKDKIKLHNLDVSIVHTLSNKMNKKYF